SGLTDDPGLTDDNDMDYLNGGDGDDILLAGAHDLATGGNGADSFVIGDWLTEGESAIVADYHAGEDALIVVYDPDTDPAPEITIDTDADGTSVIRLNGLAVATVTNAPDLMPGHITLIPVQTLNDLLGLAA
ncbi:calcium-binding protein, partial [Escherichia coli]|nr:calcium-binding protein [Escherichia coli]